MPGVIFVGHLPLHFAERPLRQFFSQFGKILKVRVSRNKNQNSRGFGYVMFAEEEVAKIAAQTMNNYLIHGKILKAEYIPDPPNNLFWDGCEKIRRPVPHAAIAREKKNMPLDEEQTKEQIGQLTAMLDGRKELLATMNYEYDFPPIVKGGETPTELFCD
ncbi:putative RNA binding [Giardia muris]|uniref:Putative RNA binding n=1 Tax=Giardia muris TaxID=5742 RepID=A0A4Z1T3S5_GIAMU|nr:putative RNA binding [Giardia muris]|eukprot:TNJ28633.1 putative RNA binding [Giardia muris]